MAESIATLSIDVEANFAKVIDGLKDAQAQLRQFQEGVATQLDSIKNHFESVQGNIEKFKHAFELLVSALGVEKFVEAAAETVKFESSLQELAQRAGTTASAFSALVPAARLTGTSLDQIVTASDRFSKNLVEVQAGTGKAAAAFRALGFDARDATRFLQDPAQGLLEVSQRLNKFADDGTKVAAVMALMGRGASQNLPFIRQLGEQLQLNASLTDEQIATAHRLVVEFREIGLRAEEFRVELANALIPTIFQLIEAFKEAATESGFTENLRALAADGSLAIWLTEIVKGLVVFGETMVLIGRLLFAFSGSVGVVVADLKLLRIALGQVDATFNAIQSGAGAFDERNEALKVANERWAGLWDANGAVLSTALQKQLDNLEANRVAFQKTLQLRDQAAREYGAKGFPTSDSTDARARAAARGQYQVKTPSIGGFTNEVSEFQKALDQLGKQADVASLELDALFSGEKVTQAQKYLAELQNSEGWKKLSANQKASIEGIVEYVSGLQRSAEMTKFNTAATKAYAEATAALGLAASKALAAQQEQGIAQGIEDVKLDYQRGLVDFDTYWKTLTSLQKRALDVQVGQLEENVKIQETKVQEMVQAFVDLQASASYRQAPIAEQANLDALAIANVKKAAADYTLAFSAMNIVKGKGVEIGRNYFEELQKEYPALIGNNKALSDQVNALQLANETYGLTADQIQLVIAAKTELILATELEGRNDAKTVAALQEQIRLRRELAGKLSESAEIQRYQQGWVDVIKGTTDRFAAFFVDLAEHGSKAFKNLWDDFKKWALEAIAKIAAQQIVLSIVGAIAPGSAFAQNTLTGAGGSVGNILSGLLKGQGGGGGLFDSLSSSFSKFTDTIGLTNNAAEQTAASLSKLSEEQVAAYDGLADSTQAVQTAAAGFASTLGSVLVGAGIGAAVGGLGASFFGNERNKQGIQIGGTVGGAIGGAVGGPLGAFVGSLIGSALGSFVKSGGGPKVEGYGTIGTVPAQPRYDIGTQADKEVSKLLTGISTAYTSALTRLGGSGNAGFALGYNQDIKGTAPSNVHGTTFVGGKAVIDLPNANVGRSPEELQTELQHQAQQMLLAALQSSDLPTAISHVLNSIAATTASDLDITQVITAAQDVKDILTAAGEVLSPDKVSAIETALSSVDFSSSANKITAVFSTALGALDPQLSKLVDSFHGTDEEIGKFGSTLFNIYGAADKISSLTFPTGDEITGPIGAIGDALERLPSSARDTTGHIADSIADALSIIPGHITASVGDALARLPGEIRPQMDQVAKTVGDSLSKIPGHITIQETPVAVAAGAPAGTPPEVTSYEQAISAVLDGTQETADKVLVFLNAILAFGAGIDGVGAKLHELDPSYITAFIDALGGAQQAATELSYVQQNFTLSTDKASVAMASLDSAFAALGLATPQTHEAFTDLLNSFDLTTEAGRALYASVIELAPAFVAVAGSADEAAKKLQSAQDFFKQNFYTDAEKSAAALADATKSLDAAQKELGVTIPRSAEGFRALVESIDRTTPAGQALYAALLALAPEVLAVSGGLKKMADSAAAATEVIKGLDTIFGEISPSGTPKIKKWVERLRDLSKEVSDNLGEQLSFMVDNIGKEIEDVKAQMAEALKKGDLYTYDALRELVGSLESSNTQITGELARYITLSAQYGDAKAEELVNLEKWYEDQKKIFKGDSVLLDALAKIFGKKWDDIIKGVEGGVTGTISELERLRKSIADYLKSLQLSDLSPLTPAQKLAEAQRQYQDALAKAAAGDPTALADITKFADNYLKQARDFYASSPLYAEIFKSITEALAKLAGTTPSGSPLPVTGGPEPLPPGPAPLPGTGGLEPLPPGSNPALHAADPLIAALPSVGNRLVSADDLKKATDSLGKLIADALAAVANVNTEDSEKVVDELKATAVKIVDGLGGNLK